MEPLTCRPWQWIFSWKIDYIWWIFLSKFNVRATEIWGDSVWEFFQSCHFKASRGRQHACLWSAIKVFPAGLPSPVLVNQRADSGPCLCLKYWPRKWSPPSQDTGNSRLSHFQRFTARPATYPSCLIHHFYQTLFWSCFTLKSHHI